MERLNENSFSSAVSLKSVETVNRLFPSNTSRRGWRRDSVVVLDMEGYSIPESLHPFSIIKQIETAMNGEVSSRFGCVTFLLYVPENTWSSDLEHKFWNAGFKVHPLKGVQSARHNLMIGDLVRWAVTKHHPSNVLILSKNNIEEYPKFSTLREALVNNGFAVASAQPEALINQDKDIGCASNLKSKVTACRCGFGLDLKSKVTAPERPPVDF